MKLKNKILRFTVITFLVSVFASFSMVSADGVQLSAGSNVITDVEFTDSQNNVITGHVASYINDELYQYLYENMPKNSGYNTLTIWTASTDAEKTVSGALGFLDNWLVDDSYRTGSDYFLDLEGFSSTYNDAYTDIFTNYFNSVQTEYSSDKYRYTVPSISNNSGTYFFGQSVLATNSYNFYKSGDYYNTIHPFYSSVGFSNGWFGFTFPVFPSSAWVDDGDGIHFYPDGLTVFSDSSDITKIYVFIPWIRVSVQNVNYASTTTVTAAWYSYTAQQYLAWLQGTGNQQAGTYDWLTSDGTFTLVSGDDAPIDEDGNIDLTPIIERLDTIIQNQNTHTSLFQQIISKLDSIISTLSNIVSNDSISTEDEDNIESVNDSVESMADDIDQIDSIESDYISDFDSNFENNTDLNTIENTFESESNGIEWLSSRIQDVYNASGSFQPIYVLPLVYGFIRIFMGV